MRKKTKWMAIGEAAKYLGISRDTLRRWEKIGRIKTIRSPTNRRYYTQKQLDDLMSSKKEKKIGKPRKRWAISKRQNLIIIGALSCLATIILVFLIQSLLSGAR